jgi:hypothetical protein
MKKAYCLAIITISMACSSPVLDIIWIWEIFAKYIIIVQTCAQQVVGG